MPFSRTNSMNGERSTWSMVVRTIREYKAAPPTPRVKLGRIMYQMSGWPTPFSGKSETL